MLLETSEQLGVEVGASITHVFVKPSANGVVQVLVSNSLSFTPEGAELGEAIPVEIV